MQIEGKSIMVKELTCNKELLESTLASRQPSLKSFVHDQ